jgi:hypothetical protein
VIKGIFFHKQQGSIKQVKIEEMVKTQMRLQRL